MSLKIISLESNLNIVFDDINFYYMHKYCVTSNFGQKLAQNTKDTNGSSNPWFNYSHARGGVVMSFSTTSSLTSTQFECAVLIDHQWSEQLYTRRIITWGGSSYKNASHRVPACACVHIFTSCMYCQCAWERTSTFFWNQQHVTVINPHKEVATMPPHMPRGFMDAPTSF
jgi:hypothetical protein